MKEKPKVTIILPNFNSHLFIKKTLDSILKQTYSNWKLFIIDDCSDNKTKSILKKFIKNNRINIFWLKKNKGAGYCRNFGIKKADSKYFAFIDSDDLWKKNKLKNQIKFMMKNKYDFTYTNYETIGKVKKYIIPPRKFTFKKFIRNTSIGTSTMIVTSKIAKKIKFTNTEICEDYYYKCKILKKVGHAHCLGQSLTKYRIRNNSLQSSSLKNFYWIWKINKKYNKLNFLDNFISLFFISLNSIKKYRFKNF
jgi:teichuronic acid biosynthesis glycosyltransferase TuaG